MLASSKWSAIAAGSSWSRSAISSGRMFSRSASTRAWAVSRPRANVTSSIITTNDTPMMFSTTKVWTNASGRSASSGRTTGESRSTSTIAATKAANQGQAREGRSGEGDGAEGREERPHDHGARRVEAAEHDRPEGGRDEDQQELRRPQEREVPVPREDDEAEDRSCDVRPRRERDPLLAHDPVDAAPEEPDREDEQCDPDEEPLAEAQLRRVGLVGADREDPV